MPLMRCKINKKNGWKYNENGRCYTGPGAKKKAIKQGIAIQENGGPKFESTKAELMEIPRWEEFRDDLERQIMDQIDEQTEKGGEVAA